MSNDIPIAEMRDMVNPNHLPMQFDVFCSSDKFGRDVRIYRKCADTAWLAKPIEWVKRERGSVSSPCFNLEADEDAQSLMDALWNAGVRPSNGEGNVGMIGAMKDHLADLRADVAFHREIVKAGTDLNVAMARKGSNQ